MGGFCSYASRSFFFQIQKWLLFFVYLNFIMKTTMNTEVFLEALALSSCCNIRYVSHINLFDPALLKQKHGV